MKHSITPVIHSTERFYKSLSEKNQALSVIERCERELQKEREQFASEALQYTLYCREKFPDLAREHAKAYILAHALTDAMMSGGRYPEQRQGQYWETLKSVDTDEGRMALKAWLDAKRLCEEWEAQNPAPDGFWWGAGNSYGWPLLFGPREDKA